MWTTFCDLALHGGPPHRGEDAALVAPGDFGTPRPDFDAIAEIRRGIFETTGLTAEPADPGWLVVQCDSARMAAWLCATIILENVEARCDGDHLYVPASWDFDLKNEVKSVITVLAKTNHYWQAHVAATQPA
jgi:sirohydrochlorin cobaltochelatase